MVIRCMVRENKHQSFITASRPMLALSHPTLSHTHAYHGCITVGTRAHPSLPHTHVRAYTCTHKHTCAHTLTYTHGDKMYTLPSQGQSQEGNITWKLLAGYSHDGQSQVVMKNQSVLG